MRIWQDKKKIGIWGAGQEGLAAYRFLKSRSSEASFTFLNDTEVSKELPEEIITGEASIKVIRDGQFDLIIKSPGISLYRPEIKHAKDKGTIFSSGTNLWFEEHADAPKIVITGTKGKSTVASLIHFMLVQSDIDSVLAGNIGIPLLECEPGEDVTVIELSSYQIADLNLVSYNLIDVAVFTNLYPEHVPWHNGDVQTYYKDKLRLSDFAEIDIANGMDLTLRELMGEDTNWIMPDQMVCPLKGTHNKMNLALALNAIEAFGYDTDDMADTLENFQTLPHRLQEIGTTANGVLYVNDSISTVPEATLAALDAYKDCSVILIMGGEDRGQDYTDFAEQIKNYDVKHVFTLPENNIKIEKALWDICATTSCDNLKEAVTEALKIATKGDVLLLSPAAPSYVQFNNFEHRGQVFKELCGF